MVGDVVGVEGRSRRHVLITARLPKVEVAPIWCARVRGTRHPKVLRARGEQVLELGDEVENGTLPKDMKLLEAMVRDICYRNAEAYFGMEPGKA
jgi:hypothetical protein